MRTFKRRGGLADDSSSTSHSLILLFRRRRSEKRSPAVVPPLSLRCVCNIMYSTSHKSFAAVRSSAEPAGGHPGHLRRLSWQVSVL